MFQRHGSHCTVQLILLCTLTTAPNIAISTNISIAINITISSITHSSTTSTISAICKDQWPTWGVYQSTISQQHSVMPCIVMSPWVPPPPLRASTPRLQPSPPQSAPPLSPHMSPLLIYVLSVAITFQYPTYQGHSHNSARVSSPKDLSDHCKKPLRLPLGSGPPNPKRILFACSMYSLVSLLKFPIPRSQGCRT